MPQTIPITINALQLRHREGFVYSKVLRWDELDLIDSSSSRINAVTEIRTKFVVKSGFSLPYTAIESILPIRLSHRQISETLDHRSNSNHVHFRGS